MNAQEAEKVLREYVRRSSISSYVHTSEEDKKAIEAIGVLRDGKPE